MGRKMKPELTGAGIFGGNLRNTENARAEVVIRQKWGLAS